VLLDAVNEMLFENFSSISVKLPYEEGALISLFHEQGTVERIEHSQGGVNLQGKVAGRLLARFKPFETKA